MLVSSERCFVQNVLIVDLQPLGELDEHKCCLRRMLHYMPLSEHPFPAVMWTDAIGTKHRTKSGTECNILEELHQSND